MRFSTSTLVTIPVGMVVLGGVSCSESPCDQGDASYCNSVDADAATDTATDLAPPPVEVCNFADDDGDGVVDEGSHWVASPWRIVLATTRFAGLSGALALDDGSLVVVGDDQIGAPSGDRVLVLRATPSGDVLAGPRYIPVPLAGAGTAGFSRLGDDKLAVVFGSTDYAGCKHGCPVTVATFELPGLVPLTQLQLDLPFLPGWCGTVACGKEVCAALIKDAIDTASPYHMVWFRAADGVLVKDIAAPAGATPGLVYDYHLAGRGDRFAWTASVPDSQGNDMRRLMFGVYSAGEALELTAPVTVATEANIQGNARMVWTDAGVFIAYQAGEDGAREGRAVLVAEDGTLLVGPTPFAGGDAELMSVAQIGGSFFALTSQPPTFSWDLYQITGSLEVTGEGKPMLSGYDTLPSVDLVAFPGGLVIARGRYDGRTIELARIRCP